jgi:N-acetylglucosamine kinase-like BadF-type ATPase
VLGVDGGNSKTDVVLASIEGEPLAWVRGPGSNSHAAGGAAACVAVIAALVERLPFAPPAEHGTFFLCGADVPQDVAELEAALGTRAWSRTLTVDNDTFALLHAGTDRADAVAIGCGSGINCVGRNASGRVARYPALGWETGDWGGADELGREALYHAARAEDGRGEPTALTELVRSHFGRPTAVAVGEDVHYGRLPVSRLGELAPGVVAAASELDAVARGLVERLAGEIAVLATRALADLELDDADVVLGGGMLAPGEGLLHELVVAALRGGARPVAPKVAPVAGAVTAVLEAGAAARFRQAFHEWRPGG